MRDGGVARLMAGGLGDEEWGTVSLRAQVLRVGQLRGIG